MTASADVGVVRQRISHSTERADMYLSKVTLLVTRPSLIGRPGTSRIEVNRNKSNFVPIFKYHPKVLTIV